MAENVSLSIRQRIAEVQANIGAACARAGRSPESVTLVAVSKTHSAARVAEAMAAGLRHFGENRVEEAIGKISDVAALVDQSPTWHMVGHAQSRKARYLTGGDFGWLHSLDSVKLAERLSRMLSDTGRNLNALLEINVSGEATKHGWSAYNWQHDAAVRQQLWDDIAQVIALPCLSLRGLMTMAPIVDDPDQARPVFTALRALRDALAYDFPGADWSDLSMGMTDDYPVAIEEGATMVRIGRAIFGPREMT